MVRREKSESKPVSVMTQRLLELRMLKYPKALAKQAQRGGFPTLQVRAVHMEVQSVNCTHARTRYGKVESSIVVDDGLSELERTRLPKLLLDVTERAPLSKNGLEVKCVVISIAEAGVKFGDNEASIYERPSLVRREEACWSDARGLDSRCRYFHRCCDHLSALCLAVTRRVSLKTISSIASPKFGVLRFGR